MRVGPGQAISIPAFAEAALCESWVTEASADEALWHTYFDFINSYGRAWYLDIEAGQLNNYHAEAVDTNVALYKLNGLVEQLAKAAQYLVAPDGTVGLPARPRHNNLGPYWVEAGLVLMTEGHAGQVHADYEGLAPYPAKLFDPHTRAYSAVLSLVKPPQGGNLKVWCKRRLGNEEPDLEDFTVEILDYTAGSLALFDSFCYHQILPSQLTEDKPFRAIAATHFLFRDDPYPHWEYWF